VDGDVHFMLTTTMELADGTVLEGKPLYLEDYYKGNKVAVDESPVFTLRPESHCWVSLHMAWIVASVPEYNISGTIGTDYKPGVRLYRTKVGGVGDYYLEKEWKHGDADFTYTAGADAHYDPTLYYIHHSDQTLGALYTANATEHDRPPQSSLAAQVGQRIFLNDVDHPERIYISSPEGGEYFPTLNWLAMKDHVATLSRVRDRLVVSSAMRWFLVDMISGYPQVQEIDSTTGLTNPNALDVSEQGLFFAKETGYYQCDLAKVQKISRRAIADGDLSAGQAVIVTPDTAIFIGDAQESSFTGVARIRDSGWIWHQARETLQHTHLSRNSFGQTLGALPTKIEVLFAGSIYQGSLVSKVYSDGGTWRPIRLILDIEGAGTVKYNVTTNLGSTFTNPVPEWTKATTYRQIKEFPLTRTPAETFQISLELIGDMTVYGYAIEVEG
jgi:hypothetical protein